MFFSDPSGVQMKRFENEDDDFMISSLMRDKSKLKRFIFILGGIIVVSLVVIVLMTTFLIDMTKNKNQDCGTSSLTQDKSLACWSSPCYNGGQCIDTSDKGFNCSCLDGFSGSRCQDTPCDNIICLNGGLCQVQNNTYSCSCRFGYFGDICQSDPCQKNPCQHGGECEIARPDYRCICPPAYSGKNCHVSPCDRVKCQNGGICSVLNNRYNCECPDDYVGHLCQDKGYKDYLVMFPEAPRQDNTATLLVWAGKSAKLNINASASERKRTYDLSSNSMNEITLSKGFFAKDRLERKNGIRVTSNIAFYIFGYVQRVAGDGFLAIPTQFLGTEYVVMMYKPYRPKELRKALFGIVCKENYTNVNITVKTQDKTTVLFNYKSYKTGDVISLTMQELSTFQLSHNSDLSGTIIKSNKPIGVFAGNKCNSILEYYCNAFLEMMLPVTQTDYLFIIPTIEKRDQYFVRVYCQYDTTLEITVNNMTKLHDIKAGNMFEYKSPHISIIDASMPVHVYGFPKDIPNFDAYMTTFYGTRQWKSDFGFVAPANSLTNHISVVFQGTADDSKGFFLDWELIHPAGSDVFTEIINETSYVTFRYQISSGSHNIHHTSNMTFGVWVYGEKSREGYGYPAGMEYLENP